MEVRTYEREKLYKEVWAEPMTTVAKRYGISDVALRKNCKRLEIPTPPNGYWAKVQAGQKIKIPPLPKSKGPNKIIVTERSSTHSKSSGVKKPEQLSFLTEEQRQAIKVYCASLIVPTGLSHPHGLIKDTIQYFRSRKDSTKPPVNRVLNIGVSDDQKERVYRIFSALFKALEHLGYSVELRAPKASHYRNYERRVYDNVIYICVGADGVPVSIKEMQKQVKHEPTKEELAEQKRYSWARIPPYDLVKNGKLMFEIDEYHLKRKRWRDSDSRKIEDQIGEIIIWIMEGIQIVKVMREVREAEEIRRLEEERRRQQLAEMRKRELEQLELLEKHASDWDRAQKIRRFADSVEIKIAEIDEVDKKEKILEWLKWARDKADWIDPLIEKENEVLGKNQYLFDLTNDMDYNE